MVSKQGVVAVVRHVSERQLFAQKELAYRREELQRGKHTWMASSTVTSESAGNVGKEEGESKQKQ